MEQRPKKLFPDVLIGDQVREIIWSFSISVPTALVSRKRRNWFNQAATELSWMRTSAEIPSPGYSHCIISIDNVGFRQSRGDSVRKKHDVFFQIQSEVTAQEQPSYAQTD